MAKQMMKVLRRSNLKFLQDAKLESGSYNGEIEIKGEKNGVMREADRRFGSSGRTLLST